MENVTQDPVAETTCGGLVLRERWITALEAGFLGLGRTSSAGGVMAEGAIVKIEHGNLVLHVIQKVLDPEMV